VHGSLFHSFTPCPRITHGCFGGVIYPKSIKANKMKPIHQVAEITISYKPTECRNLWLLHQ